MPHLIDVQGRVAVKGHGALLPLISRFHVWLKKKAGRIAPAGLAERPYLRLVGLVLRAPDEVEVRGGRRNQHLAQARTTGAELADLFGVAHSFGSGNLASRWHIVKPRPHAPQIVRRELTQRSSPLGYFRPVRTDPGGPLAF
jgi:hypothetical protein